MEPSQNLFTIGLVVILGAAAWEGIRFGVNYLLGRVTRDDYVTRRECKQCPARGSDSGLNDLKREMRENFGIVKGVLLVVASKANVPMEELKDLMK